MIIIGLTGAIGTGKSTVLEIFKSHGFITFNSDERVAYLISNNQDVINKIASYFPNVLVNNKINKDILRKTIYQDYLKNILILENIIVPKVIVEINEFINKNQGNDLILEVPLLFEQKLEPVFNCIIATSTPPEIQIKRVIERNGLDEKIIKQIIAKQVNIADYKDKINFVIDTNQPKKTIQIAIDKIVTLLRK